MTKNAKIDALTPHPKNYRDHPAEQIAHIAESIRANGFYRNVVVARDNTILAGHGSVLAAKEAGLESVPVVKLDIEPDSTAALKILAGDNEVARLGIVDDQAFAEILRGIVADDEDLDNLFGTGLDKDQYEYVTGVADGDIVPVEGVDPYAEWEGMPAYDHSDQTSFRRLIVHFKDQESLEAFAGRVGCKLTDKTKSIWFPEVEDTKAFDKRYAGES